MLPRDWRWFIEALRRGDKKALAIQALLQGRTRGVRLPCTSCGQRVQPLPRGHDAEALEVLFECSECGQINRLPMQDWNRREPEPGN